MVKEVLITVFDEKANNNCHTYYNVQMLDCLECNN